MASGPLRGATMSSEARSPSAPLTLSASPAEAVVVDGSKATQRTGQDLLDRLARGDVVALDLVLERYWAPLVTYVARLLDSRDAAEDVAQETFYRLWERRDSLRADGSVGGFLFKVAHNLAIGEQRKDRARARSMDAIRDDASTATTLDFGDPLLDDALNRAIRDLPDRRREILLLRSVHGLSYKEIARTLGIAPQTVANQLSATLSTLRRALAHLLTL